MDITEVRIKLIDSRRDKLQAFCSITLDDDFVIRDLKIIGGAHGAFVAMPSRKLTDRCGRCGGKNHLRAAYCNDCGAPLAPSRASKDERGRARLHADIAHPVHAACRERFQKRILAEYHHEIERSHEPGYVPQELHPLPELDDFDVDALDEPPSQFRGRPSIESRSYGISEKSSEPHAPAAGSD